MVKNKFVICVLVLVFTFSGLFCQSDELKKNVLPNKVILEFEIPLQRMDETLKKQINHFLDVSFVFDKKKQKSLFGPFNKNEKIRLTRSLKKASDLEEDNCFKDYLTALSENIMGHNRFFCDYPKWIDLKDNHLEIVFTKDDYINQCFLVLKIFFNVAPEGVNQDDNFIYNSFIYLNHHQNTERFREYTDLYAKMQDNLLVEKKPVTAYSPIIPSFKITDLIHASSASGFTLIYPDIQFETEENNHQQGGGFKIILFQNLAKAYYEEILKPVSGLILSQKCLFNLDYDCFLSNLVMTRISHHLGPVFFMLDEELNDPESDRDRAVKTKKKKELKLLPEIFQEFFPIIETLKSQVLAINNTPVLIKNGLIPEDKDIGVYTTHFVSIFDQLRYISFLMQQADDKTKKSQVEVISKNENLLSALVQFNFLLENEGVIFNINTKKFEIDPLKYKNACEMLVNQVFSVINTGRIPLLKNFINRYAVFPPELKQTLNLLKSLPLFVEFQPATHLNQ